MPVNANSGEITTQETTKGNFVVSYQENGYGGIIPIINGEEHPELMMGYVSPEDKLAGLKLLERALNATNGNIPQAMRYMYDACLTSAKGIKADEAVMVDDTECIIDYADETISLDGEILADCKEIETVDPSVIKAILIERARIEIMRRAEAATEEECDYNCCECDCNCCDETDDGDDDENSLENLMEMLCEMGLKVNIL